MFKFWIFWLLFFNLLASINCANVTTGDDFAQLVDPWKAVLFNLSDTISRLHFNDANNSNILEFAKEKMENIVNNSLLSANYAKTFRGVSGDQLKSIKKVC